MELRGLAFQAAGPREKEFLRAAFFLTVSYEDVRAWLAEHKRIGKLIREISNLYSRTCGLPLFPAAPGAATRIPSHSPAPPRPTPLPRATA